jgi:hypothetical protein
VLDRANLFGALRSKQSIEAVRTEASDSSSPVELAKLFHQLNEPLAAVESRGLFSDPFAAAKLENDDVPNANALAGKRGKTLTAL